MEATMKTAKYEETDKKNTYCEIYQSAGVEFAIAKREKGVNKQLGPFFKCRDFLSDAFWSVKKKMVASIYGFSHPPDEDFLQGRFRFLAKFPADGTLAVTTAWKLLKKIEKSVNIQPTLVFRTADKKVFFVSAPMFWGQNPTMISFITFIIRQGVNLVKYNLKPDPETFFTQATHGKLSECTDKHTTKFFDGYDKIKDLLNGQEELTKKFELLLEKTQANNIGDIHNRTGIASVLGGEFDKMYERYVK